MIGLDIKLVKADITNGATDSLGNVPFTYNAVEDKWISNVDGKMHSPTEFNKLKEASKTSHTAEGVATDEPGLIKQFLAPSAPGAKGVIGGVVWAGVAYFASGWIGNALGLEEPTTKALQNGLAAAAFTGKSLAALQASGQAEGATGMFAEGGMFAEHGALGLIGQNPWITGIAVGAVVFIMTYKKVSYKTVDFDCLPWEAPIGGADCEKCNDGVQPCSEYRCKSLGQACDIVNAGTAEERCVWINPKDVKSPMIRPWEDVLTKGLKYSEIKEMPPSWGTKIIMPGKKDGCIPAFTPLEFGIQTNKPAQCKIDFSLTDTYDEMAYFFGESNLFAYNHSQKMNMPSPRAIDSYIKATSNDSEELTEEDSRMIIENAKSYNLYVRCISANGFYNEAPYGIDICVDDGPDLTPPYIEETSIDNGSPVQYQVSYNGEIGATPITIYTNEPANCKWSFTDQSINDMENTMTCAQSPSAMSKNLLYACDGALTGIKDRKENTFYFRCEDQPWMAKEDRNPMTTSYVFKLIGTNPLNIKEDSVTPENGEKVTGATSSVEVNIGIETENGYKEGEAECYYSIGSEDSYVKFAETNSYKHKQRQDLSSGTYTYYLKCLDLGGNSASTNTTFSVYVDTDEPLIARIMNDGSNLKIITNEDATCSYSNDESTKCNYNIEEGTQMVHDPVDEKTIHLARWQLEQNYYIKCMDINGRMPIDTECSVIARPEQWAVSEEE